MPSHEAHRVIVAGAGIAGLATALAFSRKGFRVSVHERAAVLGEVGAGIQLSPNATRLLARLGVLPRLLPSAVKPVGVHLRDATSLREIAYVPLGAHAERCWGAPYLVIHRADLHNGLLAAAKDDPAIELVTDNAVSTARQNADGVVVTCVGENTARDVAGELLIGADGVWSTTRHFIGAAPSRASGHTAWRTTVDYDSDIGRRLAPIAPSNAVTAFLHPALHLVAYPVRAGSALNLVALGRGPALATEWANDGDLGWLSSAFAAMGGPLATLARAAAPWTAWPIHVADTSSPWFKGRIVLVGDAAHALTPFGAQGAAMAIEDAVVLAKLVADGSGLATALPRYETLRRERLRKVAARGAFNHFTWHARGPIALARNLVLAMRPSERLAADFDWLYSYDAETAT